MIEHSVMPAAEVVVVGNCAGRLSFHRLVWSEVSVTHPALCIIVHVAVCHASGLQAARTTLTRVWWRVCLAMVWTTASAV
jgi:hypothetical protein